MSSDHGGRQPGERHAGRFVWYLPEVEVAEDGKSFVVKQWPINKVLEWWEDLIGEKFYSNPGLLFLPGYDSDEARRQVHFWRYEKRTPDQETIRRWCKNRIERKICWRFGGRQDPTTS